MTLASFVSRNAIRDRKGLIPAPKDSSRWFRQDPGLVAGLKVWEEHVDEMRIFTMEDLTTCLDPNWGWTITSGGLNFLKKKDCWEGHEQALITSIWKETKRTEELEEAEYRSPTWPVLRTLQ